MGQFQSNFQTAQQIATQMRNASDTIQSATNRSITKATRTTLSVNSKAQESNQQTLDFRWLNSSREWIMNFTTLFANVATYVMEAIHKAYSNKRRISGKLYSGKTSEGMEIRFVLINDKIITVYPMY